MNAIRTLERHALDAHRAGIGWAAFWDQHGAAVCQAEPYNRGRYRRLVGRLLSLVVAGDEDGMEPAGEPWLLTDRPEQPPPADVGTAAKCLWPQAAMPGTEATR